MPLFNRPDGDRVTDAPILRHMIPYIMPSRTESAVYFEHVADLTKTLAYIERVNAGKPERQISLFQIILCAMVRTFSMRPHLNRFVVGRRLYQRRRIDFSFAIKKEFTDKAALTTTKIAFDPDDSLAEVGKKMANSIGIGRSDQKTQSDHEVDVITKLPRFLIRLIIKFQSLLDYFNILPGFMVHPDPMYASMFFANLGSVGLESAYHHLYEYGTIPFFMVVGKTKKGIVVDAANQPAVRDVVSLKVTFDERIVDGLYCAKSLDIFKRFLEDPELLEGKLDPQNA